MSKVRASRIGTLADKSVSFFSGEWILQWTPYTANGGTVVATRSLWLTLWIYLPAFLLKTRLDEGKLAQLDLRQGGADFVNTLPWLAAIFAAVYISLYTRFSSQWTYLANLFNQIVQAELTIRVDQDESRADIMASWKAAFIEDAEDLHLASKPMFLVAVSDWGSDAAVAGKFAANTVNGAHRLEALLQRLTIIREEAEKEIPKATVSKEVVTNGSDATA